MERTLAPRQERESRYYDCIVPSLEDIVVNRDPIMGKERRPWNPYWHLYQIVQEHARPGARLLDFGCGWGVASILFAHLGYQVSGFDVSEGNLAMARRLAEREGFGDTVCFQRQTAEKLDYPDASFDVIAGIDILHHVEIEPSIRECRRILKPGGIAVFREPLESPIFDTLRNTKLGRWIKPNVASFDSHITGDERKLTRQDLITIEKSFPSPIIVRFRVISRLDALVRNATMPLEKLDYMLNAIPGFISLSGAAVLKLEKPA
jgi:2-polyprenyl-3-methyl-5-hydroxy-6-metoxy-1,4-benzoquinol methylase